MDSKPIRCALDDRRFQERSAPAPKVINRHERRAQAAQKRLAAMKAKPRMKAAA